MKHGHTVVLAIAALAVAGTVAYSVSRQEVAVSPRLSVLTVTSQVGATAPIAIADRADATVAIDATRRGPSCDREVTAAPEAFTLSGFAAQTVTVACPPLAAFTMKRCDFTALHGGKPVVAYTALCIARGTSSLAPSALAVSLAARPGTSSQVGTIAFATPSDMTSVSVQLDDPDGVFVVRTPCATPWGCSGYPIPTATGASFRLGFTCRPRDASAHSTHAHVLTNTGAEAVVRIDCNVAPPPIGSLEAGVMTDPDGGDAMAPVPDGTPDSTIPLPDAMADAMPDATIPVPDAMADAMPDATIPLPDAMADAMPDATIPLPDAGGEAGVDAGAGTDAMADAGGEAGVDAPSDAGTVGVDSGTPAVDPAVATPVYLGSWCVGQTPMSTTLSIVSAGTAPLHLAQPTLGTGAFTLMDLAPPTYPVALAPGAMATIAVAPIASSTAGHVTDTVAWNAEVPAATPISADFVTGAGIANPSVLTFDTAVGVTLPPQIITLQNCGGQPLVFTSAMVSRDDVFTIDAQPPATLAPGATSTISVRFHPDRVGVVNATLTILTAGDPLVVELHGTARAGAAGGPTPDTFYGCGCRSSDAGLPLGFGLVLIGLLRRRRR